MILVFQIEDGTMVQHPTGDGTMVQHNTGKEKLKIILDKLSSSLVILY